MVNETLYLVAGAADGERIPDDQEVAFFGNPDDAVAERDALGADARVFVAEPLSESGHWDWAVESDGHKPMVYVSEHAARACVGSTGRLVRRRRGTTAWEAVSTDA